MSEYVIYEAGGDVYDPPADQWDQRVCGRCRRAWGSVLVPPPADRFSILNTTTGKYHASHDYGMTNCGIDATGDEFLWPI